jgi:L,D-transpeptidase catalytic domain
VPVARDARSGSIAGAAIERPIASLSGPISDERTTTYWANAAEAAPVRAAPRARARELAALHFRTEDGYPEVYVVLAQAAYPRETWFRVRIPGRPNGRTGWVQEQALGVLHVVHTHLVANERTLRLTLYRWGRRIFSSPIGIGKPATPTPRGNFWIREKFPAQGGMYGPYAFGTADYSVLSDWPRGGIIGIHGTDEPWLIPGHPSHGCIRLQNADVTRLWRLLPVGTPLTVS